MFLNISLTFYPSKLKTYYIVEVTLIYTIKTLVAQEGIEPPAQGYEPHMLPLHHRAILAPLCGFEPPLHMNVHI